MRPREKVMTHLPRVSLISPLPFLFTGIQLFFHSHTLAIIVIYHSEKCKLIVITYNYKPSFAVCVGTCYKNYNKLSACTKVHAEYCISRQRLIEMIVIIFINDNCS